jgi:ribose transport system permease protein
MPSRVWNYFRHHGRPFLGLALVFALGVVFSPRDYAGNLIFLSVGNLTDVLLQQSEIGIIALAMTLVIIGAGIDLSVGSVLACSASMAALLLVRWTPGLAVGPQMAVAAGAALLTGATIGAVNGLVITRLGLQAFVMTLATMIGVRGLTRWLTGNTNIDFGFGEMASARFSALFSHKPSVIIVWVLLAIVAHLVLTRTIFGRYLRAIGENEQAAIYTGLPVRTIRFVAYTACGGLAALAGLIHAARSHQGNPNDGVAYELDAIAAVVIGGTALAGGQGTIVGTVTGTLILGLLTNMLRLRMIDSNLELMIKAVIIIVAVWLQRRDRASNSSL